jgi:hypothetical protein
MLIQPSGRKRESSIKHAHNILALLHAILLPNEVLVIHCRGHKKGKIREETKRLMRQLNGQPGRNI